MTPLNFCYWLQGYFELTNQSAVTPAQAKMIQEHLHLVFRHVYQEDEEEEDSSESVSSSSC